MRSVNVQSEDTPSKIEYIEASLEDLRQVIAAPEVRSLAVPPLGAGNGDIPGVDVQRQARPNATWSRSRNFITVR